jgi:ribonuclease P protein component
MQQRHRLRQEGDFVRLRRDGRAYQGRYLLISVLPNGLSHNRYGFITSKQLGNAVTRNRVRRLCREVVRLLHPQLQVGYDIVLVARRAIVEQPLSSIQRIVEDLCRQAGLMVAEGGGS